MNNDNFDTLDEMPTINGGDGSENKMLADRYKIIRKLGEGGMGLVYLAEDTEINNEKVAIKFIPPTLANNVRVIKNLCKEAGTARKLSHPNIVRLHDLHTDGHQKFLVMEYIEGKTLEEMLAEKDNDRFTLDELLPVAEQVAAALDYAHRKKVMHRDLKPSNIMIGSDGTVKLLDFGIAREMKDSYTRVTGKEISGTLPYMGPQQLMGDPPTPSMDIYSFAAVLYECLCGHPPFYLGDIREQIKSKTPVELPNVNSAVNGALLSALGKGPAKRPKTSKELVALLGNRKKTLKYKDTLDGTKTRDIEAEKTERRSKAVRIVAAVIIITLLVIGGVFAVRAYRQHRVISNQAASLWSQAQAAAQNSDYEKTLELVDEIVAEYPGAPQAEQALAQRSAWSQVLADKKQRELQITTLLSQAQTLKNQDLLDQSLNVVVEVLKLDPENATAKSLRVELTSLIDQQKITVDRSAGHFEDISFPYIAEITGDNVLIHSGPGTNFYDCGKLNKGDKVKVIGKQFSWARIVPPRGCFSCISMQYVSIDPGNTSSGTVTADRVHVYAGSDHVEPLHSTTLQGKFDRGDKVKLLGEQMDDYYKIAPPSFVYLWVNINFTKPLPVESVKAVTSTLEKYRSLQKQVQAERTKPIEQQNYTEIKESLIKIAENKTSWEAADNAEFVLEQINYFELILAAEKANKLPSEAAALFLSGGALLGTEFSTMLEDFAKKHDMVTYNESWGTVEYKSDLLFEKGSDKVTSSAIRAVKSLCGILNSYVGKQFDIIIAGHTDDIPIRRPETRAKHPTNWHLAAHRAIAMLNVMANHNIESKRMSIQSFGEYRPVMENKPMKGGNPRNRRIEIYFISKKPLFYSRLLLLPEVSKMLQNFAEGESMLTYDSIVGMVKFRSDLLFEQKSDVVASSAVVAIRSLCTIMNSEEGKKFDIIIDGNTDDIPIQRPADRAKHPTNWHLAAHRAIAVLNVMAKCNIESKRMSIRGFSEYQPIVPNKANKIGPPQNRRVEIYIVPWGI